MNRLTKSAGSADWSSAASLEGPGVPVKGMGCGSHVLLSHQVYKGASFVLRAVKDRNTKLLIYTVYFLFYISVHLVCGTMRRNMYMRHWRETTQIQSKMECYLALNREYRLADI